MDTIARVELGFGQRVDNLQVPQGRKEMTKTMGKNLSKNALLRVVSKTLVGVVSLILVLLRVVVEQVHLCRKLLFLWPAYS